MVAEMAAIRDQLARTPVEVVIANHAFGLFELAALHLSLEPPQLVQARLAIDALTALVEGLGDRLGPQAGDLGAGLAQLRMAYVQIHGAQSGEGGPGEAAGGPREAAGGPGEAAGGSGEAAAEGPGSPT